MKRLIGLTALLLLIVAPAALRAQTYPFTLVSPQAVPVVGPAFTVTLSTATAPPTPSATQACFYVSDAATATAGALNITVNHVNGTNFTDIIFAVPASYLAASAPGDFSASGFISATAYLVPTGTACNGTVNTTYSGSVNINIDLPQLDYASTNNLPQTNIKAANFGLIGYYFSPATVVTFSDSAATSTISSKYLSSQSLVATAPNIPSGVTSAQAQVTTVGPLGNYPASDGVSFNVYSVRQSQLVNLAASPSPATAGANVTFTAVSQDAGADSQQQGGVPTGPITFTPSGSGNAVTGMLTANPTSLGFDVNGTNTDANDAAGPYLSVIADFNGDGIPDVLVLDNDGSAYYFTVYPGGYPLGSFGGQPLATTLPASCSQPGALVAGDINGDGITDIAMLCGDNSSGLNDYDIMLGNGDGTFTFAGTVDSGNANGLALGDFFHHGKLDLVIIGLSSDESQTQIQAYSGNGDGTFAAAVTTSFADTNLGYPILPIAVADISGDKYPDLVINGVSEIGVLDSNGDGTFGSIPAGSTSSVANYTYTVPPSQLARALAVADVNGDGKQDIVFTQQVNVDVVPIHKGLRDNAPAHRPGLLAERSSAAGARPANGAPRPSVAGLPAAQPGLNAAGHPAGKARPNAEAGTIQALLNTTASGTVSFSGPISSNVSSLANSPIAVANFDGDCCNDVILSDGAQLLVYSGDNAGDFAAGDTGLTSVLAASTNNLLTVQGTDLDGDGVADLIYVSEVSDPSSGNIDYNITGALTAGSASASAVGDPNLPTGTYTVNTAYNGTSVYLGSTGTITSVGVSADPTTTGLMPSSATVPYGTAISLTATITQGTTTSDAPTGTVTFSMGTTSLGSAPVSGSAATLAGVLLPTGTDSITASYGGDTYNSASTGSTSVTVTQATPTLTWAAPASISYGTALSATQLDATASVGGTFVYTPAAGAVLTAGSHTLSVTFTPTDTTDYTTATKTVNITVTQAKPTLTWAAPASISYGTALSATQLDATASTGGTFVYTPAAGTVLTAGSHTLSVTFTPTDTTDYTTATKTVNITVNQAAPVITWAAPSAISYGTALSTTQLDATASTPGTFVYTPAAGTVLAAGTQSLSVTFTPTDTTDYTTATKTVNITVNQATPVITWAAPSAITYGTALSATQLDATASVGGTFAYSPASGTVLTAGAQTLSVTFTPTDTTDYSTATKTVSITVGQATPTISWAAPSAISYGAALSATQLDATAAGISGTLAGTFVYTPAAGTVLTAGSHTLSVTFTPTDTTDYTTATKTVNITVNQATPVITWAAPSAITYGTALSATQLDATASTGGTFVYTPAAGTVLTAGTHTLSVTFTPTDTTDYTTATKTVNIPVNQAAPVITWAAPSAITYGTTLSATQLDATASTPGTFVYTPAAGTVLAAGTQMLSVTFTPTDTTDYTTATKTVNITVNQATPVITWAAPSAISYGVALSATQLDATASTGGTFVYTPASGAVLTAGSHTLSVTFTPTDTTDYTTATKTVNITVNQATPTLNWNAPGSITYGTALSATQLDATAAGVSGALTGAFAYTPAAGTVLTAGSHTLSVTFTPTDSTDYTAATKTVSITVGQTSPALTWNAPSAITYGTALSATQLDATAAGISGALAGTFAYTPASGTVLLPGAQTLSVTFTPTDITDYTTATRTVPITVNLAVLTVTAGSFTIEQGQAIPSLSYSITGFQNGDTQGAATTGAPALSTTATQSSPAGMYPVTAAVGTLAAANYTFNFVNGALTITPFSIGSLSSNSIAAGSSSATITLNGSGFNGADIVLVNGSPISTTYNSPTSLTATIPGSYLTTSNTTLEISVEDPSTGATTAPTPFVVGPAVLGVTTTALPNVTVNTAYTATLMATGGVAPYTWSVITGSLPAGLTLDAGTGAISGTPTVVGTQAFTVQSSDSEAPPMTATTALAIGVNQAQSLLYDFCVTNAACPDGDGPTELIQADDGNFYGVTQGGGANTLGTMFQLTPAGTETVLYNFCSQGGDACTDGDTPVSLVLGGDGNFYGVTTFGGAYEEGSIFQLTPAGVLTTIYSFCAASSTCPDGMDPDVQLTPSGANFFGTTPQGGANGYGTVFEVGTAGNFKTLYSFTGGTDGGTPSGLVQASDGNFYGTTQTGGFTNSSCTLSECGTIFRIDTKGALTTIYSFCSPAAAGCPDGSLPSGVLNQGADGNLYGATQYGGSGGAGTIFNVTTAGALTTVYNFCTGGGAILCNTTAGNPQNGIVLGTDGNFYGASGSGGNSTDSVGAAYQLASGNLTVTYNFCSLANCDDGSYPATPPVQGDDGNFYGTTSSGGSTSGPDNVGGGVIYKLPSGGLQAPVQMSLSSSSIINGASVTLNWSVLNAFSATAQICNAYVVSGGASAGTWTGQQSGTLTAGVFSGSATITPTAVGTYTYGFTCGGVESAAPVTLTVAPVPPPNLVSITPSSAPEGSPSFTITATGTGFSSTDTLQFVPATIIPTTFNSANGTLTGTVPAGFFGLPPGEVFIEVEDTSSNQTSSTLGFIVTTVPTTTSLVSSNLSPAYGVPITLTATIVPQDQPAASTANVAFYDGNNLLSTVASSGFTATLPNVQLSAGDHTLYADYAGDFNYAASNGTLTGTNVTPAVLTVTANNLSMQQGASVPTLTYGITGFQYSDTQATATTGAPSLSTTATSSSPVGTYPITVAQGTLAAANYTFTLVHGVLTVNPNMLAIGASPLPVGKLGVAYSTTLAASGGVAPYSWAVTTGILPAGLQLNAATGVISGTPTAAGATSFTLTVTDSESTPMTAFYQFSISINATENILDAFCQTSGCPDGENPRDGVIQASDGNFYGTTAFDGANNGGTVFKLTPAGVLTTLYNFCSQANCADGSQPKGLRQAADGNFYSVALSGGISNGGTVFKITPAGVFTLLYQFCTLSGCTDGQTPTDVLLPGADGNFYGTTGYGGENQNGTVFKITPAGTLTTLYNFCSQSNCADGAIPPAGLVQGADGAFYGVTSSGGANSSGTAFKITSTGTLTTLYSFCGQDGCTDGSLPNSNLVQGSDGNFYGVTQSGGLESSSGTIFNLTPGGTLTTLYQFCTLANCADGAQPSVGLVLGSDGNFYGTTQAYGAGNAGTFFQLLSGPGPQISANRFSSLYSFCSLTNCADGSMPEGLVQGNDGNFYGTAEYGGSANNAGLVYELPTSPALPAPVQLSLSAPSITLGSPVTLTWTVLNAFSTTAQQCYAFVLSGGATGGTWTGLQNGTLTSGVYSGSATITPTASGTYQYGFTCGGTESAAPLTLTVTPLATPTLTSVSPNTAMVGSPATTITLIGANFAASDTALVNSGAIATTFVSSTQLTAVVPAGVLAVAGVYQISVEDTSTANTSNSLPFTVTTIPTSTALTSSNSSPTYGMPISLTAAITPQGMDGASTAMVTFYDGTTPLGTVASSAFSATLPGLQLGAGTHSLSAVFAGDSIYQTSAGTLSLTVAPAALTVTADNLSKAQGAANPPLTYTITGFQYTDTQANSTTGAPNLSTTATQTSPVGTYPITITKGTLAAANYTFNFVNGTLTVNANGLVIDITSFPVGKVGVAYAVTATASGGVAPYQWSITHGALPAGLSLDAATGKISGTPTAAGVASFTLQAADSESSPMVAAVPYSIAVDGIENVVSSFCVTAGCPTGAAPQDGVIEAGDGNLYGTATLGGANNQGVFFRLSSSGVLTALYSFCNQSNCADGAQPAGLIQGGDGNFYGVTLSGGNGNSGTIFKITPSGAFTQIYAFCGVDGCPDGAAPAPTLVMGTDGNFYGTAANGGSANDGTIFKLTPGGTLTILYNFCSQANCADGTHPTAGLMQDADGEFYGTTSAGGPNGGGTVFKITTGGTLDTIYAFCTTGDCADGQTPNGFLVEGTNGSVYGTTSAGGANNAGGVYTLTPDGDFKTVYSFCSQANCADGAQPNFGLVLGSDGNFYGATQSQGAGGGGTFFQLMPDGVLDTVYTFCSLANCADGSFPQGLVQASDGNFYGTTERGGAAKQGAVYQLPITPALPAPVQLSLSSSSIVLGNPVTLTFNVLNAFSDTMQQCYAFVQNVATGAGNWTGLQTGTLTSGVYTGSVAITPTAAGTYSYALTCGGVESGFSPALTVTPAQAQLSLISISPNTTSIGAADTTITLTGTGFIATDQAQASGTAIATTFVNATTLTAVIPAAYLANAGTVQITVLEPTGPAGPVSSNALPFTVTVPPVSIVFSGPSSATSASQPDLTFTLTNPYPVELTATLTLAFDGAGGVDDPNVEFANGSRTFSFNIAANTTTTPAIQLQTGTDAGAITITLGIVITSTNQDVTPSVNPVVITIPAEAPAITSMTLTRSGDTITVNIMGYSNTRDMTQAVFTFEAANGATLEDPNITVPANTLFSAWYSTAPSDAFGSEFLYTQSFTLNDDNSSIGQVTLTLTNSAGISGSATAQ